MNSTAFVSPNLVCAPQLHQPLCISSKKFDNLPVDHRLQKILVMASLSPGSARVSSPADIKVLKERTNEVEGQMTPNKDAHVLVQNGD